MWCPEGYITLEEIVGQFMWDSDLIPAAENQPFKSNIESDNSPDYSSVDGFIIWLMYGTFRVFEKDIRACLASGSIVRLAPQVLALEGLYGADAPNIGSFPFGGFPEAKEERLKVGAMHFRYINHLDGTIFLNVHEKRPELGPVAGASICIEDARLPVRLENLTEWLIKRLSEESPKSNLSESNALATIPEKIVLAFESRKVITKADAKRMFGRSMKTEQWLAIWREAVALKPSLARPGPRNQ